MPGQRGTGVVVVVVVVVVASHFPVTMPTYKNTSAEEKRTEKKLDIQRKKRTETWPYRLYQEGPYNPNDEPIVIVQLDASPERD